MQFENIRNRSYQTHGEFWFCSTDVLKYVAHQLVGSNFVILDKFLEPNEALTLRNEVQNFNIILHI